MLLSFSANESRRFKLQIYRGAPFKAVATGDFFSECITAKPDVVILRGELSETTELLESLASKCHVILADTLLVFRKSLNIKSTADFMNSGAKISEINSHNVHLLSHLVKKCYSSYINHYHANPCLDNSGVLDGLVEFSENFVQKEHRTVLLAEKNGIPSGYLCMDIKDGVGSSVIGGSALDIPAVQRHKILCDLTHEGDRWLLERNVRQFEAVTRTDKTYIQKLLVHNMHCLPSESLATLHINLFLSEINGQKKPGSLQEMPQLSLHSAPHKTTRFVLRESQPPLQKRVFSLSTKSSDFFFCAEYDRSEVSAISSLTVAKNQ